MTPSRDNVPGPAGAWELALPRSVPTGSQRGHSGGWIPDSHPIERGGPTSPGRGGRARAASLAASRCAKGDEQMLSEESDLSHSARSHSVSRQRWPPARAEPLRTPLRRGKLSERTSQCSLGCRELWAQLAQLEAASGSGTEELKYYLENNLRSHHWQITSMVNATCYRSADTSKYGNIGFSIKFPFWYFFISM